MSELKGYVFYHGPSELDGKGIVGIAVWHSDNKKTGDMIQTYILRRDISPLDAANNGEDFSICGNCESRKTKKNICYVRLEHGPTVVWKAWKRRLYWDGTSDSLVFPPDRPVRLGAYGDPAAIPLYVWRRVLKYSKYVTGYTHQWKRQEYRNLKQYCMASCDSLEEQEQANDLGWRAFTMTVPHEKVPHALLCPASEEGGYKTTCEHCLACGGLSSTNTSNVYIPVHGARKNNFITIRRVHENIPNH